MPRRPTFQLNLRSLLAITFGVSLVMAVVSPYLRDLTTEQVQILQTTLGLIVLGCYLGAWRSAKKRKSAIASSGSLLLAIPTSNIWHRHLAKWTALLVMLPWSVYFSYGMLESNLRSQSIDSVSIAIPIAFALFYGWMIGPLFAWAWLEGFGDSLELRENGIVLVDQFHRWSSPTIKKMNIREHGKELIVEVTGHHRGTLRLGEEQYEQACEILSARYQRPGDSSSLG